jgi:hypothetical protein
MLDGQPALDCMLAIVMKVNPVNGKQGWSGYKRVVKVGDASTFLFSIPNSNCLLSNAIGSLVKHLFSPANLLGT